tara:strand:- start:367 stop:636 length:270 start_codon:yes stop_codon:yes gene_type:complete
VNNVRQRVGWIATIGLIMVSLSSILTSREVGSNSWISLLLIPFTVALALSRSESNTAVEGEHHEWDDEEEEYEKEEISPGEFGYDTPVL